MSFSTTLKNHYKSNSLSHAYLIEGSSERVLPELFDLFLNTFETKIQDNPDFVKYEMDTFKIDDVREVKSRAVGNVHTHLSVLEKI